MEKPPRAARYTGHIAPGPNNATDETPAAARHPPLSVVSEPLCRRPVPLLSELLGICGGSSRHAWRATRQLAGALPVIALQSLACRRCRSRTAEVKILTTGITEHAEKNPKSAGSYVLRALCGKRVFSRQRGRPRPSNIHSRENSAPPDDRRRRSGDGRSAHPPRHRAQRRRRLFETDRAKRHRNKKR